MKNLVKDMALKELHEEELRKQVEAYKQKLRSKTWIDKIFPYKIIIVKKEY